MTRAATVQFRPSRHRGQNFLIDRGIQRRIVQAAGVSAGATVLEIGAGTGNLSEALLAHGLRVIAVEVEPTLVERLRARFAGTPGLTVVQADARRIDAAELTGEPYHVIANLPYSVGTRIVIDLLQAVDPPLSITSLLQREVARRMAAEPDRMALLSVIVQSYATVRRVFDVAPTAFRPRPKVTSALVRLAALPMSSAERRRAERRIALARHGFGQPRKKLSNALAAGLRADPHEVAQMLSAAQIDPGRRPGSLSLAEWDRAAEAWEGTSDADPDSDGRAK